MLAASAVAIVGLLLTYQAKTAGLNQAEAQLGRRQLLNLNTIENAGALLPYLTVFPDPNDRLFAARRIYDRLSGAPESGEPRALPNVGSLAAIRVTGRQIESSRGLQEFRRRLEEAMKDPKRNRSDFTLPLLTQEQLQQLKPSFIVRRPQTYSRLFWFYSLLFFAGFYLAHVIWRLFRFQGDRMLLPIAHLLTGIGFMLMLSLRDPLRDMTLFVDFVQGVVLGCLLMLAFSFPDYQKSELRRLSFVPLLASFLLSMTLVLFGSGPGSSDAKVNLQLGLISLQPVEAIKFLLVLFLAGYFADRWEFLRELKEKSPSVPDLLREFDIPRIRYAIPVLAGVVLALLFFFLQRDLGPALIISFLFLALYATARGRAGAAMLGSLVMISGFAVAYWIGFPKTVAGRIGIWLSPWNNYVLPGGSHLAHSFWGFAAGAITGAGSGLGDPGFIPAVHTDLVLSAIGEELGFAGLLAIFALYCLLVRRAFLISLNARGDYTLWLGLGLVVVTALQIVSISGGVLGLIPFSGVVTPFLSYGRSAIVANFILLGVLASISARPSENGPHQAFQRPVLWLTRILAGFLAAVLIKLFFIQVIYPDDTAAAGALVVQSDGGRRFEYNPRLLAMARMIPRGAIYDRNDIPLATSKWEEVEQHRRQYQRLRVDIDQPGFRNQRRYYPLGALTFHVLGDLRTKVNWAASNTSFVERDMNTRLQGYEDHARAVRIRDARTGVESFIIKRDYRELMPLLRYRYRPSNEKVQEILNRNRDIHLSLDIQYQRRVAQILEQHIRRAGRQRGAAVVFDPKTGELLASATYPWAEAAGQVNRPYIESDEAVESKQEALMDRARYGIYTPGSSFKLVTASAALRKDTNAINQTYNCIRLPDGRVGNFIRGSRRPIRDDILDKAPHGAVKMEMGLALSCNAYFAQLGTYLVGAEELAQTARLFGIKAAPNNTAQELRPFLPWASYGQGQVTVTPLQMARVAATMANDGRLPYPWIVREEASRNLQPQLILSPAQARTLGGFMREVVTSGTGRALSRLSVPIAGKTGTAELENEPSHAWFVGYAPYGNPAARQLAFAVLVENGSYGGRVAAPAAGEIMMAAADLGLIGESRKQETASGRQKAESRRQ